MMSAAYPQGKVISQTEPAVEYGNSTYDEIDVNADSALMATTGCVPSGTRSINRAVPVMSTNSALRPSAAACTIEGGGDSGAIENEGCMPGGARSHVP